MLEILTSDGMVLNEEHVSGTISATYQAVCVPSVRQVVRAEPRIRLPVPVGDGLVALAISHANNQRPHHSRMRKQTAVIVLG